jgi:hypothetical protein
MTSEVPPVEGSQNDDHRTWRLEGDPAKVTLGPPIYPGTCLYVVPVTGALRLEAEAERLRAENERLCEALESIRKPTEWRGCLDPETWIALAQNTASLALGGSQAKGGE